MVAGWKAILQEAVMIKVTWDEDVCIQSGDCLGLLPEVFRLEGDRIVIDASAATEGAIRDAVSRCPSGALRIEDD